MKKVFIDGLGLVDGHFSGVGQYILGVIRGIDELIEEAHNKGVRVQKVFYVTIPLRSEKRFKEFGFKHIKYRRYPAPFRYIAALWHRRKLPWIDLWFGPGDYIFPRFADMPLLFSKSKVLTVIDLSYELHRQYSDEGNAKFLSNAVKASIPKAETIITISESAKKEIVKFYNLPSSKVKVASPAVDQTTLYRRSHDEIQSVKLKYGIKSKHYILALSNLEPRKNLESLVDAYCSLDAQTRKDTALLLVGVNGWKADALFEKILKRVEEGYDIIRPSKYVSDQDKPAIISGATLLAYPSHYEGFGIPPLEALACGVPVITADNSSLPEVVGTTGIMLKSDDTKGLAKELENHLQNIELITAKTITAGPERATSFSWKKCAQVYIDAVGGL